MASKTGLDDPSRKYGVQDTTNKSNFTCSFCGQVLKGGVFRFKQYLIGSFNDARKCPSCPDHVREELNAFMMKKQTMRAEQHMQQIAQMQQHFDEYDVDEEEDVEVGVGNSKMPPPKNPKQKGPMDMYFSPNLREAVKDRKKGRQQTINEVCRKDLRHKVCRNIARWLFVAGIPFNAATYDNFQIMVEAIGQFSFGMQSLSMYELRVSLLDQEVETVQNKVAENEKEWAEKGCLILSDGWRDSVLQKDIINFMGRCWKLNDHIFIEHHVSRIA